MHMVGRRNYGREENLLNPKTCSKMVREAFAGYAEGRARP
jgi:hypothetical protein